MTDLQSRFRTLDELRAPELWHEAERRAAAAQPRGARLDRLVFVVLLLLLALVVGAAALIGSRIVRLPLSVEATSIPSTPAISPIPSSTPAVATAPTWTATGGMIEARNGYAATLLLDGTVLVAGGSAVVGGGDLTSAERYDPSTGKWIAAGRMVSWARTTAIRLLDGKVLVMNEDGHAELYDPNSGSWTTTKSMTVAIRASQTATLLLDGRVLVTGVSSSSEEPFATAAELYDPSTGSWTATAGMIEPRYAFTATGLTNGRVLVAGGTDSGGRMLTSAELYDPSTGFWTATGSTNEAHADGHIAVRLPDGEVLVAGGYNSLGPDPLDRTTSAELYDPSTGLWTATGSMLEPHGHQVATLLPNGTVLVGGESSGVVGVADSSVTLERYDPSTGSWIAIPNMIEGKVGVSGQRVTRSIFTATMLLDGRVLVTGQLVAGSDILGLAELYDPGSRS
jgi:Kelch motif protein/galactose oxidase-like protein